MMEEKNISAYRSFRIGAYRNKYEKALLFGGKSFTFGALMVRAEYAYNTFRQMGIEAGARVCLWLPDCPDLLASFYGLSRLGAVGVLAHPDCSPREVKKQMEAAGATVLLTTAGRYARYCKRQEPLPQSDLILCRPERDMKGVARSIYLQKERLEAAEDEGYLLDRMMAENRYSSLEKPAAEDAVILFGTSCFLNANPITYQAEELAETIGQFWRHKEGVQTVYVENSFATEGGFLAVHSALSAGKTVVWSVGEPLPMLQKIRPDFLVATEEFFWLFRQNTAQFKGKWTNLSGGYQIGKKLTPLMEKFASRAMAECGGAGVLGGPPIPLKVRREDLYFMRDFGVRLGDMEQELSRLKGVAACRCLEEGGIRLLLVPDGKESAGRLGRSIALCCKQEMNRFHLPNSVEFCAKL